MSCRDSELLYERAKDSYKDRKFLYLFPRPYGSTWNAVNYDAINAELNVFLRNFEVWGSNGGQHKISEDGNHQEVWFEVSSDFVKLFEVNAEMLKAVGKMGVQVVYDYPFNNTSSALSYDQEITDKYIITIGEWNRWLRYDEED